MRLKAEVLFLVQSFLVLFVFASALMITGCASPGKIDVSKLGPPPSTQELAAGHNQRVDQLDTLWARISIRAKGTYPDGKGYEEQGEGHLQIDKPENVSLSIRKLGELYFAYGANSEQYWSFDLLNSERKLMLIGQLDQVTQDKAAILGLPIHPGELIALSGLMPIDLAGAGGSRWAEDGKSVGVSVPSSWGAFTLWIDPRTELVVRSQAFDRNGDLIATAHLSRYKLAQVPGAQPVMVPGKIELRTPGDEEGFVRIELSEPASKDIRPMVFDPNRLKRAYRVDEVIDLDALNQQPTQDEQSESDDSMLTEP